MIVTPPIFTAHHIEESKLLYSANEESFRKLIRNTNYLIDLVPIGKVMFINTNQPAAQLPNSGIWQYCDGSEITHPLSPLRTIGLFEGRTPNLQDCVLRAATATSSNTIDRGSERQTFDFAHDHTGFTETMGGGDLIYEGQDEEEPGLRRILPDHKHSVTEDLTGDREINFPRCWLSGAYMKIA